MKFLPILRNSARLARLATFKKRIILCLIMLFVIFHLDFSWKPLPVFHLHIPKVLAQITYDLACAPGTNPLQGLVTRNPITGNLKAHGCIDSTGNLLLSIGQLNGVLYAGGSLYPTIQSAVNALPICNTVPSFNGGNPTNPVSAQCGTIYLTNLSLTTTSGYTVTAPIIINSVLVRIIGIDKYGTQILCGNISPCIKFDGSNLPSFAHNSPNPISGASGGLEKLSLIGSNTASQIGLFNLNAAGIRHTDVRVIGFTGTSAIGMEFANDLNGESERVHLDDVTFDNNTTNVYFTAPSASNSIAHQYWANVQFTLSNGQTAITTDNFAQVAFEFCTGVINTDGPNTNTYTGVRILSSSALKGFFRVIVDNGASGVLTFVTGNTPTNFEVVDWSPTNLTSYVLATWDNPFYVITTAANGNNGICFQQPPGTVQQCIFLDGSNFTGFSNGTTEIFSVAHTAGGGVWLNGSTSGALNLTTTPTGIGLIPGSTLFASLGSPSNGGIIYCSDCTIANPCAGAGTGALAKRLNGVWVCN